MNGRSFFSSKRAAQAAGFAVAAMMMLPLAAQEAQPAAAPAAQQDAATPPPAQAEAAISNVPVKKKKVAKQDRVIMSKDTRRVQKKDVKLNSLIGKDASLPDKALYDKAIARGCDHPHAVRILARAWTHVIWRCWQDNLPYDPAAHSSLQALLNQDQPAAARTGA